MTQAEKYSKIQEMIFHETRQTADDNHLRFFDDCFHAEYSEISAVAAQGLEFSINVREIVVPGILEGADDQKTFELWRSGDLLATISFAERGMVVYIWGLYVHPALLREKLGTLLLREVCMRVGVGTSISIQVLAESERANLFYSTYGFLTTSKAATEVFPGIELNVNFMEVSTANCLLGIEKNLPRCISSKLPLQKEE